MVIDVTIFIHTKIVNVWLQKNVKEGFNQAGQEPNVNHFDVGCFWKIAAHAYKHCRQYKHNCNIDRNSSFKGEFLEKVWKMNDKVEYDSRGKYCED